MMGRPCRKVTTMPDSITRFENAFADWLGGGRAFAFWKGRVAMYAILKALGVGEGDEVILPGYTCVMDVNPVMYLGAKSVFVDIEPMTYNVDVALLEQAVTPRTKVIVAQHTYGYPCEMDGIMAVAGKHGLPVVEDCCLALGSTYKGRRCGTFGRAAYWSFQWNKPFTTGIGGMVTASDDALAEDIAALCQAECVPPSTGAAIMLALQRLVYRTAIFPKTTAFATAAFRWLTRKGAVVGSSATCEFVPEMPTDFFMRMSGGQARAGLRQLRKVERNLAHRREMRHVYDRLLGEAGFPVPEVPEYLDPVLVRYPVRVADKARAVAEAPKHLVEIGTWFECPLHPSETPMEEYGYREGMCPVAEKACREVVNLPTHPRADISTARRTVEFIQRIGPPA
jgi:dTDP-4-amino-4,6-dideoxygalactose transaminase